MMIIKYNKDILISDLPGREISE